MVAVPPAMHALATRLCDAFRDLMDAPAPGQTRAGAAISAPPRTPRASAAACPSAPAFDHANLKTRAPLPA
jgi:hypothetical protein